MRIVSSTGRGAGDFWYFNMIREQTQVRRNIFYLLEKTVYVFDLLEINMRSYDIRVCAPRPGSFLEKDIYKIYEIHSDISSILIKYSNANR